MSMEHIAGETLQKGVTQSGISGIEEQSSTSSAGGEILVFKDHDGKDYSIYAKDRHVERSFEAILESSAADKNIGDIVTITGLSGICVITKWDKTESNDDVKKVSFSVRNYPDLAS